MALTVSALADQAGLSADTVRYHERVGLLPEQVQHFMMQELAVVQEP